jgi:uncharacterized membrane protein
MLPSLLLMVLITLLPGLELRASIPYGFFGEGGRPVVPLAVVFLVCVGTNILLGMLVFALMGPFVKLFRRWAWFDRRVWPLFERTQHKLKPYVEKYGEIGVALFIGVPLPGSGVYTGAFGSYLLGLDRRRYALANVIGVLIAGVAVMSLCGLLRVGAMGPDSLLARWMIKASPPAAGEAAPGEPAAAP